MTSLRKIDTINFKFKDGTSDEAVKADLKSIRGITGVFNAKALFPKEKERALKYMYIAKVDYLNVPPEDIRVQIEKMKNIEYAEFPAPRRLMRGK